MYKDGLNGFDMYEDLGYVFMGWRTTGGIWQNQVIGGQFWSFNPATETYQKNFAKTFGMDYEEDIASLPDTSAKVDAMHKVLMTSDVDKESRTSVDDYKYIKRDSIGGPNLEALLNQRTKLARARSRSPGMTPPDTPAAST